MAREPRKWRLRSSAAQGDVRGAGGPRKDGVSSDALRTQPSGSLAAMKASLYTCMHTYTHSHVYAYIYIHLVYLSLSLFAFLSTSSLSLAVVRLVRE